nr:radical SAM protein [uncultured Cupriavidus sp.]
MQTIMLRPPSYPLPPLWRGRFVYRKDREYALLDPLSLETVFLSGEEMYHLLSGEPEAKEIERYLNDVGCDGYVPGNREEAIAAVGRRLREFGLPTSPRRISGFRVVLTDRCNLKCSYCFVETNSGKPDMSAEDLEIGLEFLFHCNEGMPEVSVQWFGGEPTTRFDLMEYGDALCDRFAKKYRVDRVQRTLVTNGVLLTARMLAHYEKFGYGIGISIDGTPETNHKHRTLLGGQDYSKKLQRNIQALQALKGVYLGANLTPTPENLERFDECIDYIVNVLGLKFIYVNNPIPGAGEFPVSGNKLAEVLFRARSRALARGAIVHSTLDRVYQALDARVPKVLEEVDGSITAALLPGAKMSLSDLFWSDPTSIYDVSALDEESIDFKGSTKRLFPVSDCLSCPAMAICGGPPQPHVYFLKSPRPHPALCALYRRSIELAVWDATGLQ